MNRQQRRAIKQKKKRDRKNKNIRIHGYEDIRDGHVAKTDAERAEYMNFINSIGPSAGTLDVKKDEPPSETVEEKQNGRTDDIITGLSDLRDAVPRKRKKKSAWDKFSQTFSRKWADFAVGQIFNISGALFIAAVSYHFFGNKVEELKNKIFDQNDNIKANLSTEVKQDVYRDFMETVMDSKTIVKPAHEEKTEDKENEKITDNPNPN